MRILAVLLLAVLLPARAAEPLVVEGVVEGPIDEVWGAFATSEGLRSWMAPHAEIDLRVDGLMRTNYRPEGSLGDRTTIVNRVLAFEPLRMLSIRVASPPEGFPFPDAVKAMWTVMYFDRLDARRTNLRVVSLGFTDDEQSAKMRAFFEKGNDFTLRKVQEKFRRGRAAGEDRGRERKEP